MKRLIYIFVILLSTLFLVSSTNYKVTEPKPVTEETVGGGFVYRTLKTFSQTFPDGNSIVVEAYIWRDLNDTGYYPQHKYKYQIFANSKSVYLNKYTQTWLYGARVWYGDGQYTQNLTANHPYGQTMYVQTYPTLIYTITSSDENIPSFYMTWDGSAYENRVR